jgi:uncharacterized membrane protein
MRWTIFAIAAALVGLAVAPALYQPIVSFAVLAFFSRVCHQDPVRSLWVGGVPMAVCARCFGIYLGGAAGAAVRVQHQVAVRMLAGAAAINVLDVVAEFAGLHGNWAVVRVCFGMMLGMAISAMIGNLHYYPERSERPAVEC